MTGHVYAWGDNTYNQCGVIGNCSEPKMITELLGLNVNAVLCGGGHSIAICSTGDIYAWGINSYGQCGYSGNDQKIQKVIVPGKVKGGSAGLGHTFLLSDNGEVYASGWNSHGQLGIPNKDFLYQFTKIDIKSANYISCGAVHSLVVLTSGDVLSTGGNSCGQLGLGHFANVNIFTIVPGLKDISICCCGEEFSVAVSTRCQVYTFGT